MSEYTKGDLEWGEIGEGHMIEGWLFTEDNRLIAEMYKGSMESWQANAKRIVLCWNTHDDLLNACKAVLNMRIVCPEDAEREVEMCRAAVEKATELRPSEGE